MPAPPGIHLSGPEVQQIRRQLLTFEHVAEDLRAGQPLEQALVRLEAAAAGVRFLLDRAEERRGIH
jgi:hypothetical protein